MKQEKRTLRRATAAAQEKISVNDKVGKTQQMFDRQPSFKLSTFKHFGIIIVLGVGVFFRNSDLEIHLGQRRQYYPLNDSHWNMPALD